MRVRCDRDVAGVPLLLRVAHRGRDEPEGPSRRRVDAAGAFGEGARDGGADRAESQETHAEPAGAHPGWPHTTPETTSARTLVRPWRAKMARAWRSKSSARGPSVVLESELVLASMAR